MKKDIESRKDIELLVDSFYDKVVQDDLIGHIFNDIAEVDWNKHLPKMYDFWETILFGQKGFKGNPMEVHFRINIIHPLEQQHFERWQHLFNLTIDEHFSGSTAELAKQKARSIAELMLIKMQGGIRRPGKT